MGMRNRYSRLARLIASLDSKVFFIGCFVVISTLQTALYFGIDAWRWYKLYDADHGNPVKNLYIEMALELRGKSWAGPDLQHHVEHYIQCRFHEELWIQSVAWCSQQVRAQFDLEDRATGWDLLDSIFNNAENQDYNFYPDVLYYNIQHQRDYPKWIPYLESTR